MKLKTWQISITIVCLLSGILFAVNLRSHAKVEYNPVSQRNENLVKMIRAQEKNNHDLEDEITKTRRKLEEFQNFHSAGQGRLTDLQSEILNIKKDAGLTALKGPGITITLADKKDEAEVAMKSGTSSLEAFLIHDDDIISIINDLRAAEAEAISVNGLRIVSTTDIKCAGYVILVNTTRLAPPYTIKAIGEAAKLEEQVRKGTYLVLEWGKFPVELKQEASLTIQPFKGSFNFKHAVAVKKEGV